MPAAATLTYNPISKAVLNILDLPPKFVYPEFSHIPPNHMRVRVGVGAGIAKRIFASHVAYLTEAADFWMHVFHSGLCQLDSTIVDIGCGCGRYAHHLRDYHFKSERFVGKYIGIDIDEEMLQWCRRHFDKERFEFHRSTHANRTYNTPGSPGSYYVLPVAPESVDFVFSTSLFTHLLEEELVNYCQEAFRVLRRDRCMAMYCFSVDHPPPTYGDRHTFRFRVGAAYVESRALPEAAVAYEEKFLLGVARTAGFRTTEIMVGREDWQPMLLCRK